ncbi:hypothetical protein BJY01DRAFT_214171 [Aspergillus pseudoustus]|uniref:Uncharacterized protein n=1 Tax=Aspergillus pseudoustus TaxID=1810923 RepID=A0ABR4K0G3_9EURO
MDACMGDPMPRRRSQQFCTENARAFVGRVNDHPRYEKVKMHDFNVNVRLVSYCHQKGIQAMSWR